MRILHVYKDYAPVAGGIENHIRWLGESQARHGHDVSVLVTNPNGQPAHETLHGVKIWRLRRLATVASTPLAPGFPLALRRMRPDITHLQFPYPVGEVSQWIAGRRPYVISYQSDVVKQKSILAVYRPFMMRILRAAAAVMASSAAYAASSPVLSQLDNVTVVPLGIDPLPYRTRQHGPAAEATILFVGRHRYYKGVDDLIRAMAGVHGAQLVIAGDGPETAAWVALAQSLGVTDRVRFIGHVPGDALATLYASADIFCLPSNSRAEAFGLVLLEAMAAGLPCVTTELGTGTSFVVAHGQTGFVVPPRAPMALADALNRLVADPALRAALGRAGRDRLHAHFTLDVMTDAVERVYCQVLDAA